MCDTVKNVSLFRVEREDILAERGMRNLTLMQKKNTEKRKGAVKVRERERVMSP